MPDTVEGPRPELHPEARVDSFVVRFVYEKPAAGADLPARAWHGVIRHVQSDAELYFTHWAEAEAFIGEYVVIAGPPRR